MSASNGQLDFGQSGLLELVGKLAQLGGVGVGMAVLLFAFLLLMRNQPVDKATAAFRLRTLTLGLSFAILALVVSAAQFLVEHRAAPARLTVTFSPSFESQSLAAPSMRVWDGQEARQVSEDTPFAVGTGATLKITVDELIAQARDLRQVTAAAKDLAEANGRLLKAIPAGVDAGLDDGQGKSSMSPSFPIGSVSQLLKAQATVAQSLETGDFAQAAKTSSTLRSVQIGGQRFGLGKARDQ